MKISHHDACGGTDWDSAVGGIDECPVGVRVVRNRRMREGMRGGENGRKAGGRGRKCRRMSRKGERT